MLSISHFAAVLAVSAIFGCASPLTTASSKHGNIRDPDGLFQFMTDTLKSRIDKVDHDIRTFATNDSITRAQLQRTKDKLIEFQQKLSVVTNSTTNYLLRYSDAEKPDQGGTTYDTTGVLIEFGRRAGPELIIHEITHAIQFEEGRTSFATMNRENDDLLYHVTLLDFSDEIEAFRYQQCFRFNILNCDSVDVDWILNNYPKYIDVPFGNNNYRSKIGKLLRHRTEQMGRCDKPPHDIYKGWEKDYLKGCKMRHSISPTGICSQLTR